MNDVKKRIIEIERLANSKSLGAIDRADSLCYSVNLRIYAKQALAHTIREAIRQGKVNFNSTDKSDLLSCAETLEKEFEEEKDMLKKAMGKLYK